MGLDIRFKAVELLRILGFSLRIILRKYVLSILYLRKKIQYFLKW